MERKYDVLTTLELTQSDIFTVLICKGEVWGVVTYVYHRKPPGRINAIIAAL